mmetsp:Transcript_146537/g.207812  ORF Transcript_146537/g.207812 Transcript_146537/m.207812 type:complete len:124 (-) Transcript_146537:190-561(-)
MANKGPIMKKDALLACIGDEDTCTGVLLGGIGDKDKQQRSNVMVCNADTPLLDIETKFKELIKRTDIAILLINQHIADEIEGLILSHDNPVPTIVVIPSKEHAYDPSKDPEMVRAKMMFSGDA